MATTRAALLLKTRHSQPSLLLLHLHRNNISSSSTTAAKAIDVGGGHRANPHEFAKPWDRVGSWSAPARDPREARARLDRMRREYAKELQQLRRQYAYESELIRAEEERHAEARREAHRLEMARRKAASAAAKQARAADRKGSDLEFRQTLMKEKAEKLELWRAKMKMHEEKKAAKKEVVRQKSSEWVSEADLESRILQAMCETTAL